MTSSFDRLRFVPADHLKCSGAEDLEGIELWDPGGHKVGNLCGVIVDPSERRVRYFVLENGRVWRRHYLMPICPAQLTDDNSELHLQCESEAGQLREFDPDEVAEFSDDDLLDAMFARGTEGVSAGGVGSRV